MKDPFTTTCAPVIDAPGTESIARRSHDAFDSGCCANAVCANNTQAPADNASRLIVHYPRA